MDKTEELFNKLLDVAHPELVFGALDAMAKMSKEELFHLRNRCEDMNRAEEAKNHRPD